VAEEGSRIVQAMAIIMAGLFVIATSLAFGVTIF
jgi:hypothetical protein